MDGARRGGWQERKKMARGEVGRGRVAAQTTGVGGKVVTKRTGRESEGKEQEWEGEESGKKGRCACVCVCEKVGRRLAREGRSGRGLKSES